MATRYRGGEGSRMTAWKRWPLGPWTWSGEDRQHQWSDSCKQQKIQPQRLLDPVVVQSLSDPMDCSMDCSIVCIDSMDFPRVCSNSCPSSRWCHPTISPSVTAFSSCLQYFPISGSFPMTLCIKWPKYWCLDPKKCLNARQRTPTCRAMGCTRHCGLERNKLQPIKLMWTTKRKTFQYEKTEFENLRDSYMLIVAIQWTCFLWLSFSLCLSFIFNFYFYFILLYNTVLVLPYIDMNPPRVYVHSQTWIPLPPPSP